MMRQLFFFCIGAIVLSTLCIAAQPQSMTTQSDAPQLMVKGEATLSKPADQLLLTVGVVTEHSDPQQALRLNNEKMAQVIQHLDQIGLSKAEYQTGQFQIHPVYMPPPKEPTNNWQSTKISHYEVTNTLQIKTQQLDLVGKIITAAAQAGSNQIDSIQFNLKDPRLYRAEAIEQATQHAIADANTLAKAAKVELVGVRSIALDQTQYHFPTPRMAFSAAKMESSDVTPIEAGEVEVRAVVDVVFEISSQLFTDIRNHP